MAAGHGRGLPPPRRPRSPPPTTRCTRRPLPPPRRPLRGARRRPSTRHRWDDPSPCTDGGRATSSATSSTCTASCSARSAASCRPPRRSRTIRWPPSVPPGPTSRRCSPTPTLAPSECDTPMGRMTLAEHVDGVVSADLVLHGWDLARAAGLDDTIDPGEVERMWPSIADIPDEMRIPDHFGPGIVVFGPEVPVPATAPMQDRLLGKIGRDPAWVALALRPVPYGGGARYGDGRGRVTAPRGSSPCRSSTRSSAPTRTSPNRRTATRAHIDPAYRDQAPHMVTDPKRGDLFVVPGMKNPIAIGLVAAAGKPAEELTESGVLFDEIHRSGWDADGAHRRPAARRRLRRGHLPDDRDDDLQPPRPRLQAGVLPGLQPLDQRLLRGGPAAAARAAGRRPCAASTRASPTSRRSPPPDCAA